MTDRYVDEIALDRALRADRAVWASLTPYEREEALVRVRERRLAEQAENEEWVKIARVAGRSIQGSSGFLPHPRTHPDWLVAVTQAAGYAGPDEMLTAGRRVARARQGVV